MTRAALLLAAVLLASPPAGAQPMTEMRVQEVRIVHRPRHRDEARQLARMTPKITRALRRDLGLGSFPAVEVRVAQSPDDLRALSPDDPPPPAGALGVAYPRRGLVVVSLSAGAATLPISLEALYTHELSHVALGEATGYRRIPRWFSEGVAIRHSGELPWGRLEALWGATVSGNLVPISKLDRAFPAGDHQDDLAYAESGELVGFLAEGDRPGALAELCARIKTGVPFRHALEANYATDLEELQEQFFERLDRRFSIIPALTGMGALWGVVALLLVSAYRRKKREAHAKLARMEIEERAEDEAEAAAHAEAGAPPEEASPPPLPDDAAPPDGVHRVYRDGRYHTVH